MALELLMGNQAIALGAVRAGVGVVSGYPGTPSTEVLETVAAKNPGDIYVEWSVNEKAALEVAAGAAYTGKRSMVTMKQVGLNACMDPVMSLSYIGVKGGMVIVVADDPGPISSQTEQDTRYFAGYAKLPVLDPSCPREAYQMVQDAFELSEKYQTPVVLRPTTRVCHACEALEISEERKQISPEGFVKDNKWVIFPKLSYQNHQKLEARRPVLAAEFDQYPFNRIEGKGRKGILTSGISYAYVLEALKLLKSEYTGEKPFEELYRICKIATAYPFPEGLASDFLKEVDEVLAVEELEPVLEKELLMTVGRQHLTADIRGRLTGDWKTAGENSTDEVKERLRTYLGLGEACAEVPFESSVEQPALPVRPPVLCAGCPHRASFYAVKTAMKGKKAVFSGDIGCYTLGNTAPLDMVDTCLCMGAGVTMAQGLHRGEPDTYNFGFIGDSTFFHTGIPGVVNAVYNQTKMTLIVLDNSTTAMTGHQPHPGTGRTMMGNVTEKVSISRVLEGIGVKSVVTVDPLDFDAAVKAVEEAVEVDGVSAIIFKSPCIAVTKPKKAYKIEEEKCINCRKCLTQLGCPAITTENGRVVIDASLCYGCGLCTYVCPTDAIGGGVE